jgi:hypothetical protein
MTLISRLAYNYRTCRRDVKMPFFPAIKWAWLNSTRRA